MTESTKVAQVRIGTVVDWHLLSPILTTFRLNPEGKSQFPDYKAGQYMALRRERCRLTKKLNTNGRIVYVTDLDENGKPKLGPVTHSYSIASAPFETTEYGYLEFYVVLETDEFGEHGRLTGSLFGMHPLEDNKLTYVNRTAGDFTLEKRAKDFRSVVFLATGTGLAPFISMIKQLHFDASRGTASATKYTLLYANRSFEELGYHEDLQKIEAEGRFDFVYIPSVSRPGPRDFEDPRMGTARANNLLRHILGMPLKEEEALAEASARGDDVAKARSALDKTTKPRLPSHISGQELLKRMHPPETVILTCGNALLMADIQHIAQANHIHFEKEDW